MRSYEFSKMDEARAKRELEDELNQANAELVCALGKVNRLREKLDKNRLKLTNVGEL